MQSRTAWRVEGTLREFPKFLPKYLWFDYPIHRLDEIGVLKDLEADGEAPPYRKASRKAQQKAKEKKVSDQEKFENAVVSCNMGDPPTVNDLVQWYSSAGKEVTDRTIRNWVKKFGFYIDKNNGNVIRKKEETM